jgi:hypothetical protein
MIFEVIGKATPNSKEAPLFSAEVTSVQMMDTLLLFYKRMGLIPGAETFEITSVIPNGKRHQYHVPRPLISYGINSYRRWLARTNPELAKLSTELTTV